MDTKISVSVKKYSRSWLLKMAWRDSRRSRSKLFLFTTSIAIGIAALVAINSFKRNLDEEIQLQAKTLLGADLEIYSNKPFTREQYDLLDSLGEERSSQTRFGSMVYFPRTDGTRLVQVRGIRGFYPYYGKIETEPHWAAGDLTNGPYALVDEKLMLQFNVELGDEVRIGSLSLEIRGKLKNVPGQSGVSTSIAPVVYISESNAFASGLIKKGSRVTFSKFYKYPTEATADDIIATYDDRLKELELRSETVEERKKDTSEAFANMSIFLNLAAFIALLLGSIGVAGAVHIYLKEKNQSVAILRCLGVKSKQAFYIYLYQVLFMGLIGSMIGTGLGLGLQYYLPKLLGEILPFSFEPKIFGTVILEGILLGLIIAILFALLPLIRLGKISPLQSIRATFESNESKISKASFIVFTTLIFFLLGFAYFQIGEWKQSLIFVGGLAVTFGLLALIAKGLMAAARKVSAKTSSFLVKQGIANLHRPNNQSTILLLTIGICAVLISTLLFSRFILVEQITLTGADERPNMVLFDIQTKQKEELKTLVLDYDLPVAQDVPIVTMRLKAINGINKKAAERDSTLEIPSWVFNREYRVTFRDSLINSETLAEGKLQSRVESADDSIFVSVSEGFAEGRKWKIGDELLFNVQGALIKTYIGSFRKVDWRRVQTNFLIVFPTGVLEQAPQFHVLVTKVDKTDVSARFQQAVVRLFPNVSIIDLELIIKTVEEVLNKVSFAINFMAGFSVLTGLIVLAGSVVLSKTQRVQESVLLRTIGARSYQIFWITCIEYFALGAIASLAGLFLAHTFSYLLAEFVFENDFLFSTYYTVLIFVAVTLGTVIIGLFNIRPVLKKSPLEILRKEI
ncbi:putative ABC transport system permease protein [Reichenbachiella faecimaris]|uniref:Putative ABC transport system permease protein n=1 Tax=Reichenbachiella faecimaris TaxID=692418 RepID=A0A1W2GCN7_REIFA|nr:FtsX-like permease family protein [Reichenbachiella faecimaris]SMD34056.1 putative ABC transport system permease protein [Reichenbachiella faecimaris]